jgi:hypothetical protein
MTSYQEITRKVGDQWVAALKAAEDNIVKVAENLDDVRWKVELPDFPAPEALTKLNEALSSVSRSAEALRGRRWSPLRLSDLLQRQEARRGFADRQRRAPRDHSAVAVDR